MVATVCSNPFAFPLTSDPTGRIQTAEKRLAESETRNRRFASIHQSISGEGEFFNGFRTLPEIICLAFPPARQRMNTWWSVSTESRIPTNPPWPGSRVRHRGRRSIALFDEGINQAQINEDIDVFVEA